MGKVLLLFVAMFLAVILFPFGVVVAMCYPERTTYLLNIAIGIDQLGNATCGKMMNHILIKKEGYQFGFEEETISSVIGKNQLTNTLKRPGRILNSLLSKIQKNHSVISIENFTKTN